MTGCCILRKAGIFFLIQTGHRAQFALCPVFFKFIFTIFGRIEHPVTKKPVKL